MKSLDDLGALLRAAVGAGAPGDEAIGAFVDALRERAAALLEEQTGALRERCESAERERDWRAETNAYLEREVAGLRRLRDDADRAHSKLLAHHRELRARHARELARVADAALESPEEAAAALRALAGELEGTGE